MNALTLKGWIYLSAPKEDYILKGSQVFEAVLNEEDGGNHKHLEALLGRAKFYEKNKKFGIAIEILSEVVVMYKNFTPAMIEKAKLHIISADWDLCLEAIQKVLMYEKNNIEALRMYIFYLLSRECNMELVEEKMEELMRSFSINEPKNSELYYKYSKLFARICGRKDTILRRTSEMCDRACVLQTENSAYTTELGY